MIKAFLYSKCCLKGEGLAFHGLKGRGGGNRKRDKNIGISEELWDLQKGQWVLKGRGGGWGFTA